MLVIRIDGGLVQSVLMSDGDPEPVVICDGDIEGSDDPAVDTPWEPEGKCNVREFQFGCGPLSRHEESQVREALDLCNG